MISADRLSTAPLPGFNQAAGPSADLPFALPPVDQPNDGYPLPPAPTTENGGPTIFTTDGVGPTINPENPTVNPTIDPTEPPQSEIPPVDSPTNGSNGPSGPEGPTIPPLRPEAPPSTDEKQKSIFRRFLDPIVYDPEIAEIYEEDRRKAEAARDKVAEVVVQDVIRQVQAITETTLTPEQIEEIRQNTLRNLNPTSAETPEKVGKLHEITGLLAIGVAALGLDSSSIIAKSILSRRVFKEMRTDPSKTSELEEITYFVIELLENEGISTLLNYILSNGEKVNFVTPISKTVSALGQGIPLIGDIFIDDYTVETFFRLLTLNKTMRRWYINANKWYYKRANNGGFSGFLNRAFQKSGGYLVGRLVKPLKDPINRQILDLDPSE